jgi:rubrerythrin
MIKYLADSEALKVAMNLEKDGIEFYTKAISLARDIKSKDMFLKLVEDEKQHYRRFKELHDSLKDSHLITSQVDEEVSDYLRALVSTGIFDINLITKNSFKGLSSKDAILVGIQAEKESILFYTEAIKNSENPKGKKAFVDILKEEKKHLISLSLRLRYLSRRPGSKMYI